MAHLSIKSLAQQAVAKVMQLFNHQSPTAKQACPKKPKKKPQAKKKLTIKKPDKYSGPMRQHNAKLLSKAKQFVPPQGSSLKGSLDAFAKNYEAHKGRYEAVGKKTGFPPALVAALHWRESSGQFDRMLSNGAPLNKKSTIVPYDGPYNSWEDSAVAVLNDKSRQTLRKTVGLDKDPDDLVSLATFAEVWNGTGYYNKGVPSPYAFSGTDVYSKGKYVADGKYDPHVVDKQIGVVPMLVRLRGTPVSQ